MLATIPSDPNLIALERDDGELYVRNVNGMYSNERSMLTTYQYSFRALMDSGVFEVRILSKEEWERVLRRKQYGQ